MVFQRMQDLLGRRSDPARCVQDNIDRRIVRRVADQVDRFDGRVGVDILVHLMMHDRQDETAAGPGEVLHPLVDHGPVGFIG